jgi:hypothetical protein
MLIEEVNQIRKDLDVQRLDFAKTERNTYKQAMDIKKEIGIFKAKMSSDVLIRKNVNEVEKMVHGIEKKIHAAKQERTDETKNLNTQIRDIDKELAILCGDINDYEEEQTKMKANAPEKQAAKDKKKGGKSESGENDPVSENEESGAKYFDKMMSKIKSKIEDIETAIEKKGGRYCGWIKEDHDDFLKILLKNGKNLKSAAFKTALHRNFPLFSEDELNHHIDLYSAQLDLTENKRKLVDKYKLLQKRTAENEITHLKNDKQNENKNLENLKIQQQKDKELKKRKEQLEKWQKIREKEAEEVKKREQQEKEKHELSMEERKQRDLREKIAKQEALKKYKEKKEMELKLQEEKQKLKERLSKPILYVDDIVRIKQKEDQLVRRKSELKQRKTLVVEEKSKRLNEFFSKFDQKFQYVQSNLLHQTTAVVKKQTKKFNPEKDAPVFGNNYAGVLVRTEGRRLVQWRQNI